MDSANYTQLYTLKPRYTFGQGDVDIVSEFFHQVFGDDFSLESSSSELKLKLPGDVVSTSDNHNVTSTAIFETSCAQDSIDKAIKAGALRVQSNEADKITLSDPFGLRFTWSYKEVSTIPVQAHLTHVPALCSERLSWLTANDHVHSEPYQLFRNRNCDYLSNLLETKLSSLDRYQQQFDDGINRVAYYALPFFSCSSLSELISLMRRMVEVSRWVEIVRCTSPELHHCVETVSNKLISAYDALFSCLPNHTARPELWCAVSSELYQATKQVLDLLQNMKKARKELMDIRGSLGYVSSAEDQFMSIELETEIQFWTSVEKKTLKWTRGY